MRLYSKKELKNAYRVSYPTLNMMITKARDNIHSDLKNHKISAKNSSYLNALEIEQLFKLYGNPFLGNIDPKNE